MDIVDIQCQLNKHINTPPKRHVSFTYNISTFISIDNNKINENTRNIINKNKKFLNQKNKNIIFKCIKYNINITPIAKFIDMMDIYNIIELSFTTNNLYSLDKINKQINIDRLIIEITNPPYFCYLIYIKNIKHIKFLHKNTNATKEDFMIYNNQICEYSCNQGDFSVTKYLHKKIGFNKCDFQHRNCACFRYAKENGHINILKYLHENFNLSNNDLKMNDYLRKYAQKYDVNNMINVVRYLYEIIKLPKEEFTTFYTVVCNKISKLYNEKCIDYLENVVKIHQ